MNEGLLNNLGIELSDKQSTWLEIKYLLHRNSALIDLNIKFGILSENEAPKRALNCE